MPSSKFPRARDAHLAERVPAAPQGVRVREWTLRDDNGQHYHGRVRVSESPLYVRLSWRADAGAPVREVGLFRLHLGTLLAEDYIRPERMDGPASELRLRFHRADDRVIYIQSRGDAPALPVGEL